MEFLRRAAERLSRRVVLNRKLPKRFGGGPITVSPGAALRYWRRNLETVDPTLLDTAEELVAAGDTVWDVGANVGLFAFAASGSAGKSGRVLALEPDAWLVGLLHESASKRSDAEARVDVLPLAVSDRVEVSELKLSARGRAVNFLESGSSQSGGIRGVQSVLVVSLDWVLGFYPTPDVLKIDVEGAELAVLRGAETLLRTKRPKYFAK